MYDEALVKVASSSYYTNIVLIERELENET